MRIFNHNFGNPNTEKLSKPSSDGDYSLQSKQIEPKVELHSVGVQGQVT